MCVSVRACASVYHLMTATMHLIITEKTDGNADENLCQLEGEESKSQPISGLKSEGCVSVDQGGTNSVKM